MHFKSRLKLFASVSMLSFATLGCGKQAEITSYELPVESKELQRMLVATILRGETSWFIKAMGPPEVVEDAAAEWRGFVDAIEFPDEEPNEIAWSLPNGWKSKPASGFRYATLVMPYGEPSVEVAISKLPYRGNLDSHLLSNVNRWRGQIGLDPVEKVDSAAGVETIEVQGNTVWLFDETGTEGGSMMPPFAGRGMAPPPSIKPETRSEAKTTASKLEIDIPDDWEFIEPGPLGSRKYRVGEGESAATFKLIDFAVNPAMADPLGNVNMWRSQMGVDKIDQKQLEEVAEKISIGETEGILVPIEKADQSERMLAAMLEKGGRIWFFQLMGTPKAVKLHREAFVQLLGEVTITVPESAQEGE